MMMNNEDEKKRAEIFLERETIVHITTNRGIFLNGPILEVGSDFFVIKDRFEEREQIVLFSELKKPIEPFREVERVS
jgi:hypothetical protein